MFGQFGQIAHLLKNAGKIKQGMQEMNARLADARHTGESGGGQVTAVVDGRGDLVSIKLNPTLTACGDVEMLEDLIVAAVRDAVRRSREALQQEVQAAAGGLDLGDLGKYLGGQP